MKAAQFQAKYNRSKPNFNDEIIFHCKIGRRSENAARIASKLGYTKYVFTFQVGTLEKTKLRCQLLIMFFQFLIFLQFQKLRWIMDGLG